MALKKNPKYDLRIRYERTLKICVVISLILLIGAFKLIPEIDVETKDIIDAQELMVVDESIVTKQDVAPPPPPKPPIPIELPDDTEELPDIELGSTDIDDIDNTGEETPPPIVEDTEPEPVPDFFAVVEKMPAPIGGIRAIMEKIKYPEFAKRAGIQGRVIVKAYVNENGDVVKAEILESLGMGCDEEAMKAILATKFSPGEQRGKRVKVQVTVPIKFVLR